MRFAIAIPQFYADGEFDPAAFRAYLTRAEELGFDSAWTQEQLLGTWNQLAPIETMTYAAACTERLRLGCVVFVSTLYSPVHLAKSLSTLDQLSRGRIEISMASEALEALRRLRRAARAVRGAVHRGDRADEGAVDAAPRHLRRRVLATPGRSDGAQAVPEAVPAALVRRGQRARALRRAVRLGDGFFGAGSTSTARFAEQVMVVRAALAQAGRPTESFPIAKRVYVAIDDNAERARARMNAALAELYGRRVEAIEVAAVAGTTADCVRELYQVAEAGAELILCTALFDQAEQMEQLAAAVIPKLG